MTDAGLFPEPQRAEVADFWAKHESGWEYQLVGEEGEFLAIGGHCKGAELAVLLADAASKACTDPGDARPPVYTYARLLNWCPDHPEGQRVGTCMWCREVSPTEPWLDWFSPEGPQHHRLKPGYFPVTIVDLGA